MTATPTSLQLTRAQLRRQMRRYRRSLSPVEQRRAALSLKRHLARQPLFIRSKRIALYLANDGEIDPRPLLDLALRLGKRCYLPVLAPGAECAMWFIRYDHSTPMQRNRYGIAEPKPQPARRLKPQQLDLVLMPLVAFDADGGRLGMGGGYYDRCFAFKRRPNSHKPYLLGLAHDGQQSAEPLPLEPWDVPLAAICTDQRLLVCNRAGAARDFRH